jgi:hypothetical protein
MRKGWYGKIDEEEKRRGKSIKEEEEKSISI